MLNIFEDHLAVWPHFNVALRPQPKNTFKPVTSFIR
jgi:hypothetical protein